MRGAASVFSGGCFHFGKMGLQGQSSVGTVDLVFMNVQWGPRITDLRPFWP